MKGRKIILSGLVTLAGFGFFGVDCENPNMLAEQSYVQGVVMGEASNFEKSHYVFTVKSDDGLKIFGSNKHDYYDNSPLILDSLINSGDEIVLNLSNGYNPRESYFEVKLSNIVEINREKVSFQRH